MVTFGKIVLSFFVLNIAMVVAAAVTELAFGELRSGLVPMIMLVLAGPFIWLIWRKRGGKGTA